MSENAYIVTNGKARVRVRYGYKLILAIIIICYIINIYNYIYQYYISELVCPKLDLTHKSIINIYLKLLEQKMTSVVSEKQKSS